MLHCSGRSKELEPALHSSPPPNAQDSSLWELFFVQLALMAWNNQPWVGTTSPFHTCFGVFIFCRFGVLATELIVVPQRSPAVPFRGLFLKSFLDSIESG